MQEVTEGAIEADIVAAGLTAPRVTPTDVDNAIQRVRYFTAKDGIVGAGILPTIDDEPLTLITFCVITTPSGYTVTGESAVASPENFNAEIGQKVAFDNARNKLWPLLGFALKNELANQAALAAANNPPTPAPTPAPTPVDLLVNLVHSAQAILADDLTSGSAVAALAELLDSAESRAVLAAFEAPQ